MNDAPSKFCRYTINQCERRGGRWDDRKVTHIVLGERWDAQRESNHGVEEYKSSNFITRTVEYVSDGNKEKALTFGPEAGVGRH